MKNQPLSITITPKSIFVIFLMILFGLALWKISTIILVILTAVVLASLVESISVGLIRRLHLPRIVAVIGVYIFVLVILSALIALVVPTFAKEIGDLSLLAGSGDSGFGGIFDTLKNIGETTTSPFDLVNQLQGSFAELSGELVSTLQSAFGGVLNVILVIVISFYLAIEERGVSQFLRAVTPLQYEEYVISVWQRTEYKIGAWFRGQLLQAVILATLTYLGLWVLGVPYALMLSVLAAVLGMIPFGIVLAGLVALFVAFSAGGVQLMLFTLIWYTALQQVENYILQPLIINRATGLPPLVVLLSVVIGVGLIGFLGLILAIPIAVVLMELVRDYEADKKEEMQAAARTIQQESNKTK